jgi:hypothetical protein
MAQATSVNGNASLALHRETNVPTGAITFTWRVRVASWTGGNSTQKFFRVEGGTGAATFYVDRDAGDIVCEVGSFNTLSSGSYSDWGLVSVSWDGSGVGTPLTVAFTPDGGSPTSANVASRGDFWSFQAFGLPWEPGTISNQVHGCTLIVWDGQLTSGELTAQAASDDPIDTSGGSGATVNAIYRMDDASTVLDDDSGNSFDFDSGVSVGTGQTVSDSPYPEDANIAGDATATATTAGTLTGIGAIVGSCSPTAATDGQLSGLGAVAGACSPTVTTAGALTGVGDLAGASLPGATTAGQLSGIGDIAGAASCSAVTAGAIEGVSPGIEGTAVATATTIGAFFGTGAIAGAAVCTATTAGRVTNAGTSTATRLSATLSAPTMAAAATAPALSAALSSPALRATLLAPRLSASVSVP